eukprot:sb/3472523/
MNIPAPTQFPNTTSAAEMTPTVRCSFTGPSSRSLPTLSLCNDVKLCISNWLPCYALTYGPIVEIERGLLLNKTSRHIFFFNPAKRPTFFKRGDFSAADPFLLLNRFFMAPSGSQTTLANSQHKQVDPESRNRPKQVNNQSELVIWSRHCLSANQGPVFPDSVGS